MPPPAPWPLTPGPPPASPASVADTLVRHLTAHGLTGIYTATTDKVAIISVTTGLTVWTDGRLLWYDHGGQRHTWPAARTGTAATTIAALAGPGTGP